MMRVFILCGLLLLVGAAGCAHRAAARGEVQTEVTEDQVECPNLSGDFAGSGRLVHGDSTQQIGARLPADFVFPIGDREAWSAMRSRYRRDDHGIIVPPDVVRVTPSGKSQYLIATFYGDMEIGAYASRNADKTQSTCRAGVLYRTYEKERTRSDYGPNDVTTDDALWIDADGDLIFRRNMSVEYHALLLNLPMGAGHFFQEYRFRRVSRR
jgi:hypothetical protein